MLSAESSLVKIFVGGGYCLSVDICSLISVIVAEG